MTEDYEPTAEEKALDAEASVFMKRGIALMEAGDPSTGAEALDCFDKALAIRQRLPVTRLPGFAYGLAACWLNRADVLTRLGGTERFADAVGSCDHAIALLETLPLDADSRFRRRLAIAHQHRGLALMTFAPERAVEAAASFRSAGVLLRDEEAARIEDRDFLLAAVLLNLANSERVMPRPEAGAVAEQAALEALALVQPLEEEHLAAAEVGLKARHLLCRVVADRLTREPNAPGVLERVHSATDAVDDGLTIVRHWQRRGVLAFGDLARDLFMFGAMVYERYQPQFLQEYLEDWAPREIQESPPN